MNLKSKFTKKVENKKENLSDKQDVIFDKFNLEITSNEAFNNVFISENSLLCNFFLYYFFLFSLCTLKLLMLMKLKIKK